MEQDGAVWIPGFSPRESISLLIQWKGADLSADVNDLRDAAHQVLAEAPKRGLAVREAAWGLFAGVLEATETQAGSGLDRKAAFWAVAEGALDASIALGPPYDREIRQVVGRAFRTFLEVPDEDDTRVLTR